MREEGKGRTGFRRQCRPGTGQRTEDRKEHWVGRMSDYSTATRTSWPGCWEAQEPRSHHWASLAWLEYPCCAWGQQGLSVNNTGIAKAPQLEAVSPLNPLQQFLKGRSEGCSLITATISKISMIPQMCGVIYFCTKRRSTVWGFKASPRFVAPPLCWPRP